MELGDRNTVGITPRKENIPLTIDANYVVGFDYTRNWQLRMVKDFGPAFSLGVSVEAPAQQVSNEHRRDRQQRLAQWGDRQFHQCWLVTSWAAAPSPITSPRTLRPTSSSKPRSIRAGAITRSMAYSGSFPTAYSSVRPWMFRQDGVCATTGAASLIGGTTSNKTTYGDGDRRFGAAAPHRDLPGFHRQRTLWPWRRPVWRIAIVRRVRRAGRVSVADHGVFRDGRP